MQYKILFYTMQIIFTNIQKYFMTQFERLEKVAKLHFGSLAGVARLLDKKPQSFYSYKSRDKFGELLILQLAEIGINPKYITDGEEPMLLESNKSPKKKPEPNVASVDYVEMIELPDITKMSPEQMRKWREAALKTIDKIDKILEVLG